MKKILIFILLIGSLYAIIEVDNPLKETIYNEGYENAAYVPKLPGALSYDESVSGELIILYFAEAVDFGDVCYLHTDGLWYIASASVAAENAFLVMACDEYRIGRGVGLVDGYVRDDSWTFTAQDDLYLGEDGAIENSAPADSSHNSEHLGYALTPTIIRFRHDMTGGTSSGGLTEADIDTYAELNAIVADQTLVYDGGSFHDGFFDFVANEHIDWTISQAPTVIHADNYTSGGGDSTKISLNNSSVEITDGGGGTEIISATADGVTVTRWIAAKIEMLKETEFSENLSAAAGTEDIGSSGTPFDSLFVGDIATDRLNALTDYIEVEDDLAIDYGEYLYFLHNGWTALDENDNYRFIVDSNGDFRLQHYETLFASTWGDKFWYDDSEDEFRFNAAAYYSATPDFIIGESQIFPELDNNFSIGVNTLRFSTLHIYDGYFYDDVSITDDLDIGGTTSTDGLTSDGSETTTIFLQTSLTTGQYTSSEVYQATAGESLAFGDVIYLKSADSEVYICDADDTATFPALGFVVSTATDGNTVNYIKSGRARLTAWSFSNGDKIYIKAASSSGDCLTATAPTTTDYIIQKIGQQIATDIIEITIPYPYFQVK